MWNLVLVILVYYTYFSTPYAKVTVVLSWHNFFCIKNRKACFLIFLQTIPQYLSLCERILFFEVFFIFYIFCKAKKVIHGGGEWNLFFYSNLVICVTECWSEYSQWDFMVGSIRTFCGAYVHMRNFCYACGHMRHRWRIFSIYATEEVWRFLWRICWNAPLDNFCGAWLEPCATEGLSIIASFQVVHGTWPASPMPSNTALDRWR